MRKIFDGPDAALLNKLKAVRALPSSWYRSEDLYELERRAIFSQKWMLVSHKLRYVNPGDYAVFEEAGYQFFLCLDREGVLNGFHNVCRHRAYPIIKKQSGNAKIFSCQYHGWSYGLKGNLAKAPHFGDVPGFDKSIHNLLSIHVHIDDLGFVWVNLDSSATPIPWVADFAEVDRQERFKKYNFTEYHFDHTWEMEGKYNWKTLGENYNECYHCPTTHPDVSDMTDMSTYYVDTAGCHIQHFCANNDGSCDNTVKLASTFYFPNSCMTVTPNFFYLMRCVPTSPTTTHMEYEVYRHKDATDEDFSYIDSAFKRILGEDKDICTLVQKNLSEGVFVAGRMHPVIEKGTIFFQSLVRNLLRTHRAAELEAGHKIWPARHRSEDLRDTEEDVVFCEGLACDDDSNAVLAW